MDKDTFNKIKNNVGLTKSRNIPCLIAGNGEKIMDDLGKANYLAYEFSSVEVASSGTSEMIGTNVLESVEMLDDLGPLVEFGSHCLADGSGNFGSGMKMVTPDEIGAALNKLNGKKK